MAYTNLSDLFKGICDAIRAKKGTTGTINHQNIPSEIASIGGFKYKQIQVVAQNLTYDVFTFTLDDYDMSQDYIKFIFGEIILEEAGYIVNFHGTGSNTDNDLLWALTADGSIYTGNGVLFITNEGNKTFTLNCAPTNNSGRSLIFREGNTHNLYVVYGH